jgi:hypothetical protein
MRTSLSKNRETAPRGRHKTAISGQKIPLAAYQSDHAAISAQPKPLIRRS